MKKAKYIIALLCLIGLTAFAQQDNTTVTGTITNVHTYNDQYAMTVNGTNLVLIVSHTKGSTFEINQEYSDILIMNKGKYELNPKYSGKTFVVTYYVNGKGWKCIKEVKLSK